MSDNNTGNFVTNDQDFTRVVNILVNMFGEAIDRDTIQIVVESCGGERKYCFFKLQYGTHLNLFFILIQRYTT